MPQIVSGLDPKVRMEAYLAGQQGQQRLVAQQEEAMANDKARREKAAERIQEAMLAHKKEQAKALEDTNKRAQMGDVIAMQQQEVEAKAAGMPADQKRYAERAALGAKITDPDARKLYESHMDEMEKGIQQEEQKKALDQMVQAGVKDEVITPEEIQQRQAMGEEPEQLGMEISKRRVQKRQDAVAMEKNTKAVEKMRKLLENMPTEDNPDYDQALEVTLDMEQNPSRMTDPNAGKLALDIVQRLAAKDQARKMQKSLGEGPSFMGIQMSQENLQKVSDFGHKLGRNPFKGQTDAAAQSANPKSLKRGKAAQTHQAPDAKTLMQSLREQGLDLNDPAVLEQVKQRLLSGTGQ